MFKHYEAKLYRRTRPNCTRPNWIGAQFCVYMLLNSRDKSLNMFQNVSGFRVQIPLNFVGTLILCRIPQQANRSSCSGFGKRKQIPQM